MSTSTKEEYDRLNSYEPPDPIHLKGTQLVVEQEEDPLVWREFAMCRGITGKDSPFFPHGYESKLQKQEREFRAKQICGMCAVRGACLEYALATREPHGIWGGANEVERKAMLGIKRNRSKQ